MAAESRGNKGQSLVELGLLMPFLIWILAGVIDFARVYYYDNVAINAARAGVRVGADSSKTTADIRNAVIADAAGKIPLVANNTYIPVTETATGNPTAPFRLVDSYVTVEVKSSVKLITPLISSAFGSGDFQLHRSATMKVIY